MKLTLSDERHIGSLTSRVEKIRVKCHSDNSHSQDCQCEGMTFRILRMSDISISGFHYFGVSTFGWIDVKPTNVWHRLTGLPIQDSKDFVNYLILIFATTVKYEFVLNNTN